MTDMFLYYCSQAIILSDQYDIFHFITMWENLVKKSEELFFWYRIDNIAQCLNDVPPKSKQYTGFRSELLCMVKDLINNNDTEKQFVEKLAPETIKALASLPNGQFNIQQIKPHFEKILCLKKHEKYTEEINATLIESLDDQGAFRIQLCMEKLIKFMLDDYPPDIIKQLPRKIFAKKFFEYYKIEIIDRIASMGNRIELFNTWYELPRKIIHEKIREINEDSNLDERLERMFMTDPYWERETQFLSRKLIQSIADSKEIQNYFSTTDFSKTDNLVSDFTNIAHVLLRETIKNGLNRIGYCFLVNCFYGTSLLGGKQNLEKNRYCEKLSAEITSVVYDEARNNEYFHSYISDAISWKLVDDLACKTAENIHKTEEQLGLLAKLITNAVVNKKVSQTELEQKDSLQIVLQKFNFVYSIQLFYRKLAKQFAKQILETIDGLLFNLDDSFIESLVDSSTKKLFDGFNNPHAFTRIPNGISKEMMVYLINGVFEELNKPKRRLRVYLLVRNFDCGQKSLKIGDVTFYDARNWDFGEGNRFDLDYDSTMSTDCRFKTIYAAPYESFRQSDKTYHRKRNSGRAYVDVLASDATMATTKALTLTRKALDPLVFAFASKTHAFRPQIPINFRIMDPKTKAIGVKRGPSLETRDDLLTVTDERKRVFSSYDYIVMSPNSELKEPILRALAWFHKGFWEEIPHEKFVSYWIGLEQLIMSAKNDGGPTEYELLELIPNLVVGWKETGVSYSLEIYLEGILEKINKNPELKTAISQNSTCRNWERNPYILLENLEFLKSAFVANSTDDLTVLRVCEYFTPEKVEQVSNTIRMLRDNMKMKVSMLYAKRNQIFHEGLTYDPLAETFCKVLEPILTKALSNVLQFNYVKTLKNVIYETNRPYQI